MEEERSWNERGTGFENALIILDLIQNHANF